MPFGSKYQNHTYMGSKAVSDKYSVDLPDDKKKAMKVAKDYDSVKNTVMEGDGQVMHNKNQTISNLKKPLPKGARK